MFNNEPNMTRCGRICRQTVLLTFGLWDYRANVKTIIDGNEDGFFVIEEAIENIFNKIKETPEEKLCMCDKLGDNLECFDDENLGIDWLKSMLISAEITERESL